MAYERRDDDSLAYGEYHGAEEEQSERGIIGDMSKRLFGRRPPGESPGSSNTGASSSSGGGLFSLGKLHEAVHGIGAEIKEKISNLEKPAAAAGTYATPQNTTGNRYSSFAPERHGNEVKWYVDGCSYMWAVSVALENARESIWILDWWLSPELYLRRPPAKHEQYRLDRMLLAAAERGVKVNIIVYKEVTQALTRKFLNPVLPDYLHSLLPTTTDPITKLLTRLGLDAIFKSLEEVEKTDPLIEPPVTVSSAHTKHALEALHKNIAVMRHPDHMIGGKDLTSSLLSSIQNSNLTAATASRLPGDTLKAIYGMHEDTVLYWAHHEKLCLVDGRIAFMGGLDLCYGRWDTNQHSIADAHPSNLDLIVYPGQDFNNARIMDFQDVSHWENNKLDRTQNSRMGWSDASLCLTGPAVEDLKTHFATRWNFLWQEKYQVRKDDRYTQLSTSGHITNSAQGYNPIGQPSGGYNSPPQMQASSGYYPPTPNQQQAEYYPPPLTQSYRRAEAEEPRERGLGREDYEEEEGERGFLSSREDGFRRKLRDRVSEGFDKIEQRIDGRMGGQQSYEQPYEQNHHGHHFGAEQHSHMNGFSCQIVRSCAKWSHGGPLEHSIQNAYIEIIKNSKFFVYIEQQFFISATCDDQRPIKNKIGAAIVERILRAAREGEKYMMIVMMPAIPAFAGDLRNDESLGTRAIMEFQYRSINRGHGKSIYETLAREGVNPMQYIRFYNLRNYDRINVSGIMAAVEQQSGISYEEARKEHDVAYGGVYGSEPGAEGYQPYRPQPTAGSQYGYDSQSGYDQPSTGAYQAYHPGNRTQDQVYEMDAGQGQSRGFGNVDPYQEYQQAASHISDRKGLRSGRWDSVAECYMLGGEDIRNVPWEGNGMDEIDAFVSEELYIHSKLLIADDRIVIMGSANLNDRSQVGDHDSEIAIVIQDSTPCNSLMNGRPHHASRFAASLRRQLFRKHLGLLPPQDMERPDANFNPLPSPNSYDWGSKEDELVADPLSDAFLDLWFSRAKTNTDAFARVFHPVPFDGVRTWKQYDEYYGRFFRQADEKEAKGAKPSTYKWGHVVAEEFTPGVQGVKEVKEVLSRIKGTLVEMPLMFLKDEDIAKSGLSLNAFTEAVYT